MMVDKFASERVTVAHGDDGPIQNGLYVAEVYHGWKLLEWHDGGWWHQDKVGRWSAPVPVRWVGPLPSCKTAKPVFDL